jgi:signal transduction histidine kinase
MTPRAISVPEMHFGRYVALAMLLVVASFSATLAVSQWRLQPIEALALEAVEQLMQIDSDLARNRLEKVDEAVIGLKALNTSTAQARSNSILQARRGALRLATALGTVSLIVAVIAGLLVLRVSRSRDRLMLKHGRLLAERATELEAFAGRVAHDLKNPLGAMAVLILLAGRRRGDDPKLREDLGRLTSQVKRMDQIIDGLLAFARSGANPLPGARADLRAVLDEVTSEARLAAEAAAVELRIGSFPATELACTPAALTSILSNLLGNAAKYIGGGRQTPRQISIRVENLDAVTRIEVEDTGPGLPPGADRIIFEPFRRLTEGNQPGIGLGLATVKKLVDAYKGRVGVVSTEGCGSIFWFEIPNIQGIGTPVLPR